MIVQKEFIHVLRDPRTLLITIVMPILLLLLLGYTTSLDIKGVPMAIYDQSNSSASRALIEAYRTTDSFALDFFPRSYDDLRRLMDSGKVLVGMIIPPDYAANIADKRTAEVAFAIDGSNPTIGEQLLAIVTMVGQAHGMRVMQGTSGSDGRQLPGIDVRLRIRYNPELDNVNFMVPAIIGMILQMICSNLTAAAIVRERERGTMEQLNITPIRSIELILGQHSLAGWFLPSLHVYITGVGIACLGPRPDTPAGPDDEHDYNVAFIHALRNVLAQVGNAHCIAVHRRAGADDLLRRDGARGDSQRGRAEPPGFRHRDTCHHWHRAIVVGHVPVQENAGVKQPGRGKHFTNYLKPR